MTDIELYYPWDESVRVGIVATAIALQPMFHAWFVCLGPVDTLRVEYDGPELVPWRKAPWGAERILYGALYTAPGLPARTELEFIRAAGLVPKKVLEEFPQPGEGPLPTVERPNPEPVVDWCDPDPIYTRLVPERPPGPDDPIHSAGFRSRTLEVEWFRAIRRLEIRPSDRAFVRRVTISEDCADDPEHADQAGLREAIKGDVHAWLDAMRGVILLKVNYLTEDNGGIVPPGVRGLIKDVLNESDSRPPFIEVDLIPD
ncbi:MAG: hypothetical protein IPK87_00500 [Planctomycetes bacterium]|nr:hypothetical protein [Planctomycetota bacterium]